MSGLQMKSVKYSSKGGYSIEWHEPGSVRLNVAEVLYLLAAFKNDLSAEELERAFSPEERETIYRYQETLWKQLRLLLENEQDQSRPLQALQKELKIRLQGCVAQVNLSFGEYLREVLCWPEPDSRQTKANQAFRNALNRHCFDRTVYERLAKSHGLPGPKILAEVEWRIGGPLVSQS